MQGHNLVLVTKDFDKEGYDKELRSRIRVGKPVEMDVRDWEIPTWEFKKCPGECERI